MAPALTRPIRTLASPRIWRFVGTSSSALPPPSRTDTSRRPPRALTDSASASTLTSPASSSAPASTKLISTPVSRKIWSSAGTSSNASPRTETSRRPPATLSDCAPTLTPMSLAASSAHALTRLIRTPASGKTCRAAGLKSRALPPFPRTGTSRKPPSVLAEDSPASTPTSPASSSAPVSTKPIRTSFSRKTRRSTGRSLNASLPLSRTGTSKRPSSVLADGTPVLTPTSPDSSSAPVSTKLIRTPFSRRTWRSTGTSLNALLSLSRTGSKRPPSVLADGAPVLTPTSSAFTSAFVSTRLIRTNDSRKIWRSAGTSLHTSPSPSKTGAP